MTAKEIAQAYQALLQEYRLYAAEARACGYEVLSFEQWTGEESPKAAAEARWQYHYENDTLDLY